MGSWGDLDDDLKLWVWVYRDLLAQLDRHDAYWIEQAQLGWPEPKVFREFLVTYRVVRGPKAGRYLSNKSTREQFRDMCLALFAPALPESDYFEDAQQRWILAKSTIEHESGGESGTLWSATLKTFWFCHPTKLPMYDSYAHEGLARICQKQGRIRYKSEMTPERYLIHFQQFYESTARPRIHEAAAFADRPFPYPHRIADGYLWLIGSGKQEDVRRNQDSGFRLAPLHGTEAT